LKIFGNPRIVVHNEVSQPFGMVVPGKASNPCPKSIPNNPNAGINNPTPAERLNAKGL
jgi:hypothetical protein